MTKETIGYLCYFLEFELFLLVCVISLKDSKLKKILKWMADCVCIEIYFKQEKVTSYKTVYLCVGDLQEFVVDVPFTIDQDSYSYAYERTRLSYGAVSRKEYEDRVKIDVFSQQASKSIIKFLKENPQFISKFIDNNIYYDPTERWVMSFYFHKKG